MDPRWYLRRLSRMGPREIAGRVSTAVRVRRWRGVDPAAANPTLLPGGARFTAPLPVGALAAVPAAARTRLVANADRIMDGYADYFGVTRSDLVAPDWSSDPKTGRRAPTDRYAFDVPYRDEEQVGDVKQLWEPSRHHHLTVLAAAYALTGEDRYANRVADHLKSWWAANPPLRGVHWVSGIELGIRLLSWVWVRRLLDGWSGAAGLFEDNAVARHQVWWHQRWLAAFPSRGSSANNHVIAENAGQLAAACAFAWFTESAGWRDTALRSLDTQLCANTFPSGVNRELASEYHGLVQELGLAAAAEATAAGLPVPRSTWLVLLRMTDALAAVLDAHLEPPRQGDADDGHGLVVDGAATQRWSSLLATGDALFGRRDWWPAPSMTDVRTPLLAGLVGDTARTALSDVDGSRPVERPGHFADAGLTILRARTVAGELWCRCDGGPHGFLSIAAHAHADALSVELRVDGVDILADPGCYCYHGEPKWRAYFRSTRGHNTLELDGADQSASGGPFMWTRHAQSRVLVADTEGPTARWSAEHDGYPDAVHRRAVELTTEGGGLRITDEVLTEQPRPARLALHLGPLVTASLDEPDADGVVTATLFWRPEPHGAERAASLRLPAGLDWTAHRGEENPPLGWYSAGFGRKEPATTLVGAGVLAPGTRLHTVFTVQPD